MVDRFHSIIGDSDTPKRQIQQQTIQNHYQINNHMPEIQIIIKAMKKLMKEYRHATTAQQQKQIGNNFIKQQYKLKQYREKLTIEFKQLQNTDKNDRKILLKQYLLETSKNQLKLETQMNEMIEKKQNKLKSATIALQPGSQKLKNALNDINQKRNQIIYLQQQAKQCVNLINIIELLTLQGSQKIDLTLQNTKTANQNVDKSEKVIKKVKQQNQGSCYLM